MDPKYQLDQQLFYVWARDAAGRYHTASGVVVEIRITHKRVTYRLRGLEYTMNEAELFPTHDALDSAMHTKQAKA